MNSSDGLNQQCVASWCHFPFPPLPQPLSLVLAHFFLNFFLYMSLSFFRASLVAQTVKCLPTMRETWVRSLGREDPLEKEMPTHSSILAWKIPWTEDPCGLQSTGSQSPTGSFFKWKWKWSVMPTLSDSPWSSLGQNTEVGSLSLPQGIFPTQGSNPGLPH